MEQVLLDQIIALRAQLHACAEVSGREAVTKHTLLTFLREHTSLELHELAGGFYAAHREPEGTKSTVALRADYDALATPQGGAAHLCGHDGHAAALCGVALMLEGQSIGRSVFLLFQGAEETGAGAALCCELFDREKVDEIYGAHNLPGFPFGAVLTRAGTFACASRGVTIHFVGKPAHAAYPETGISPAPAVGQLLVDLPALAAPEQYRGITLCTVIGAQMGEKAFGAAAESAELWLTLRGEHDDDLARLRRSVLTRAQELAHKNHLEFSFEEQDIFPATENDALYASRVMRVCRGTLLHDPMRWSEDFGHYLHRCRGAFFGVGAGEDHPQIHTEPSEYPDTRLEPTGEVFQALLTSE